MIVGVPGTRCWPYTGSNLEAKLGFRIDIGELIRRDEQTGEAVRQFNVQFNKNAEHSTLRKYAASHSHEKRIILEFSVNAKTNAIALSDAEIQGVIREDLVKGLMKIGM